MSRHRLSKAAQDDIVEQLDVAAQTDTEKFEKLHEEFYEQLDVEHKMELSDYLREFADNAIGSEHWDSDA